MLHGYVILYYMARGDSGRIVLEIDPSQKDELYSALTKDGMTLKDWFLRQADQYLSNRDQFQLFGATAVSEKPAQYRTQSKTVKVPSTKVKSNRAKTRLK